jgi:hypothetical protein
VSRSVKEPAVDAPRSRSSAGYVLALLFIGNLLNFYDRALPSVVLEPIDALAAGSSSSVDAEAQGLQTAMMIAVPLAFAVAAVGMLLAARFVKADREAMLAGEAVA